MNTQQKKEVTSTYLQRLHICIIGSGLAGLGVAKALVGHHKITLVDTGDVASLGASYINGGQVDPYGVHRLAETGIKRFTTEKYSTFFSHPQWLFNHALYRLRPWKHDDMDKGVKTLAKNNLKFIQCYQPGLLHQGEYWDMMEHPPLKRSPIWTGSSWEFCNHIKKQIDPFVDWKLYTHMKNLKIQDNRVVGVEIHNGPDIVADVYVVCTGAHLGKHTGLPILPIAGVVQEIDAPSGLPDEPVIKTKYDQYLFWANLGNGRIRNGEGALILSHADSKALVPRSGTMNGNVIRRIRAVSPDGVPMIGLIPGLTNAYVVGGFGFYGWTLGFAGGYLMGEHLSKGASIPTIFNPNRFKGY